MCRVIHFQFISFLCKTVDHSALNHNWISLVYTVAPDRSLPMEGSKTFAFFLAFAAALSGKKNIHYEKIRKVRLCPFQIYFYIITTFFSMHIIIHCKRLL